MSLPVFRSISASAKVVARHTKFDGRDHLVTPTIAILGDIVMQARGASGPEFVPAEVVARVPEQWNGRPVVLRHPVGPTANDPGILERQGLGTVFNAEYRNGALQMESWLDTSRALKLGDEAVAIIRACEKGEVINVSIGAWVAIDYTPGTTRAGVKYSAKWTEILPNHLAILPDEVGACSVDDGCGTMRAAAQAHTQELMIMSRIREAFNRWLESFPVDVLETTAATETPTTVTATITTTPAETISQEQLSTTAASGHSGCGCNKGSELTRTATTPTKEEGTMPTKAERVKALIDNAASPYAATDTEVLAAYDDSQLSALEQAFAKMEMRGKVEPAPAEGSVTAAITPPPATAAPTVQPAAAAAAEQPNAATTPTATAVQPRTLEDYISKLPQPVQDIVNRQLAAEKQHRDNLINDLVGVQKKFTAQQLAAKPTDELQSLHELLVQPPDFSGVAGLPLPWTAPAPTTRAASDVDHMPPSSWKIGGTSANGADNS